MQHGLIHTWGVADAGRYDGALPPVLLDKSNTAVDVWADTTFRLKAYERHPAYNGQRPSIGGKELNGRPMPANIARANGRYSKVRGRRKRFSARAKLMGLVVRSIGLARAQMIIGLANLLYNMKRAVWLTGRAANV